MTIRSRAALHRLLAEEMDRLQKAIRTQEELTRPGAHQVGDDADHASRDVDQGKNKTVVAHLKQLLAQVESARERLAAEPTEYVLTVGSRSPRSVWKHCRMQRCASPASPGAKRAGPDVPGKDPS